MSTEPERVPEADEPPPILGSWRNIYLFLAGELAALVVSFYLIARWAS